MLEQKQETLRFIPDFETMAKLLPHNLTDCPGLHLLSILISSLAAGNGILKILSLQEHMIKNKLVISLMSQITDHVKMPEISQNQGPRQAVAV